MFARRPDKHTRGDGHPGHHSTPIPLTTHPPPPTQLPTTQPPPPTHRPPPTTPLPPTTFTDPRSTCYYCDRENDLTPCRPCNLFLCRDRNCHTLHDGRHHLLSFSQRTPFEYPAIRIYGSGHAWTDHVKEAQRLLIQRSTCIECPQCHSVGPRIAEGSNDVLLRAKCCTCRGLVAIQRIERLPPEQSTLA